MINTIIKALDYLLNYLKDREKNPNWNKKSLLSRIFLLILWCLPIILFDILIFSEILNKFELSIIFIGLILIVVSIFSFMSLYRNLNWKYFFIIHLPFILWVIFLWYIFDSSRGILSFYGIIWLLNSFILIYPLITIFTNVFTVLKNIKTLNRLYKLFYLYNIWFFLLLATWVLFSSLGVRFWILPNIFPWLDVLYEFKWNSIYWFFEWLLYVVFLWILLLYPIYSLHVYYDHSDLKRMWVIRWLSVFFLVWFFISIPTMLSYLSWYIYDSVLNNARETIKNEWYNYDSHKDVIWFFLERAFLHRIKNWKTIDEQLFSKIFDSNPEEHYWERIADFRQNRRSFATKASKIWDSAEVVFKLAEIDNKVVSIMWNNRTSFIETTYNFYFENESKSNQEVIINFEAPAKDSIVTSLKLWLDLELIGQIASRWAARKVYEDSLRRNTDPALIEKVWLSTYNLRVFPIPWKTDQKTNWKQRVEVKMLTSLDRIDFEYSPKLSMINLKFDDESRLISKVYDVEWLKKEDLIESNDIQLYILSGHSIWFTDFKVNMQNKLFKQYCISDEIKQLLNENIIQRLDSQKVITTSDKINLFFDNSLSVNKFDVNKKYSQIYSSFKNFDNKLNNVDIFSYNFEVIKHAKVDDIKYWWYTDIDRVLEYIENNISWEKIVFITDDDSFNFTTLENNNRNIEKLVKNNINVLKIWKKVKLFKNDFNTILAASNWNIYSLDNLENLSDIVSEIYLNDTRAKNYFCSTSWKSFSNYGDTNISKNIVSENDSVNKLHAWIIGNQLLSTINDSSSWIEVADIQNKLAERFWIVNQFNSMIALETQRQQQDLDIYETEGIKYNTEYKNYWVENNSSSSWSQRRRFWSTLPVVDLESDELFITNNSVWSTFDKLSSWRLYNNSYSYSISMFRWTDVSFFWLIILIIYIIEYISVITFISKLYRNK